MFANLHFKYPWLQAYYHGGEPLYDKMVLLFGFEYVKKEGLIGIVEISEDRDDKEEDKDVSDEVTSPPILPHHQLFHENKQGWMFIQPLNTHPPKPIFIGKGGKNISNSHGQS